ncbi:MAG: NAD-dependent epimerase/dehydratase family protein [Fimbriimonadaceae bacterium]|nr:NAD-dependent epimerase/dehydratase family protein [Fimbriimonadaceae bacterium]QYK56897.1 MAG: NAD-dependent epimerase/dehydratase family protein [Fimbriimonadaceae bacterium]
MNLLVLGGTQFVGRHFVEAALAGSHEVTLFHRGKTGADLFPEAEHVLGDRLQSLAALEGGKWDAVVDVSAYVPRAVRMAAEALADCTPYYLQVSTVSVYATGAGHVDETSPLATVEDPAGEVVDAETYGGLKALCEEAALAGFGQVGIVRPTFVVGPYDHTERFTYWVDRIGRNAPVTLPLRGDGSSPPLQFIDARDLGAFMLHMVEQGTTGAYNAAAPSLAFLEALERTRAALGSASEIFTPRAEGDADLPMVLPSDGSADPMLTIPNERAVAAGLRPRTLEATVQDLWQWWRTMGRPTKFDGVPWQGSRS